jgi:hypothetical protein
MSRSRLGLTFKHVCACRKLTETTSTPSWSGTRSGGTHSKPRRQVVCQILGCWSRDRGPPAVSGASRLLVLPIAARRWVSIDNTRPVHYRCSQAIFPLGRAFHCQQRGGPRNLSTPEGRQHKCWQLVEYWTPPMLLPVEDLLAMYPTLFRWIKVHILAFVYFMFNESRHI